MADCININQDFEIEEVQTKGVIHAQLGRVSKLLEYYLTHFKGKVSFSTLFFV